MRPNTSPGPPGTRRVPEARRLIVVRILDTSCTTSTRARVNPVTQALLYNQPWEGFASPESLFGHPCTLLGLTALAMLRDKPRVSMHRLVKPVESPWDEGGEFGIFVHLEARAPGCCGSNALPLHGLLPGRRCRISWPRPWLAV